LSFSLQKFKNTIKKKAHNSRKSLQHEFIVCGICKKPFGNAKSVVEYLGKYTHKIPISNQRIKNIDNQNLTFQYKDYRMAGAKNQMTLTNGGVYQAVFAAYFAQRFCEALENRIKNYSKKKRHCSLLKFLYSFFEKPIGMDVERFRSTRIS